MRPVNSRALAASRGLIRINALDDLFEKMTSRETFADADKVIQATWRGAVFQIRIHDAGIRLREPVMQPDAPIIQNPTLRHQVNLFNGLT